MNLSRLTARIIATLAAFSAAGGVACAAEEGAYAGIAGDLVFWSIVTFVVFILAIRKLGWGSFVGNMTSREHTIVGLIADAERTQREAEQVLREHRGRLEAIDETTRELLAEARRDAQYTRELILTEARAEAETLRHRALREISRARDQALDEIFDTLTDRVTETTQQRLVTRLTATDQNRLIDEALASLTTQRA